MNYIKRLNNLQASLNKIGKYKASSLVASVVRDIQKLAMKGERSEDDDFFDFDLISDRIIENVVRTLGFDLYYFRHKRADDNWAIMDSREGKNGEVVSVFIHKEPNENKIILDVYFKGKYHTGEVFSMGKSVKFEESDLGWLEEALEGMELFDYWSRPDSATY